MRKGCRVFGCDYETALRINGDRLLKERGTPAQAYVSQRKKAMQRGIEWRFTFPEWMRFWLDSGKWEQRGRRMGQYCMARHGDVGPYAADNVSIQLVSQNARDAFAPYLEQARALLRQKRGRGWTRVNSHKRPYAVHAKHRYVGCFATQEEAERAYAVAVGDVHE